jgi:hypothetical protein
VGAFELLGVLHNNYLLKIGEPSNEGAADRGEYRRAAGAIAEAVIRSVELIFQPDAKYAVGVVALGPAKRIILENRLPRPTASGRTER